MDGTATDGPHGPADDKGRTAPETSTTTTTPHGETPEPHGEDEKQTVEAIKREARKWESQSKRNKEALDALRDQVKTLVSPDKVQSTEAALDQTKAELAATRLEALRYRVALSAGLPADLAQRLVGSTEDELIKDAAALKALVKPVKGAPDAAAGTNTTPDGAKPTANDALRMALGYPTR